MIPQPAPFEATCVYMHDMYYVGQLYQYKYIIEMRERTSVGSSLRGRLPQE